MEDRYLFKAKRIDNGEWVIGFYVRVNESDFICTRQLIHGGLYTVSKSFKVDTPTICQCTGLRDKNGQKIWENDILVAHLDENYPEDETYEQVIWHESGFCTMEKNSTDCEPLDGFDTRYFAVCGNIFDNAELLERKE